MGEFWADPFLWQSENQTWIFFERYNYLRAKGEIACLELKTGNVLTALARPFHLSYPHLFEHNGTLWMLPESSGNGTVDLYRCEHFPATWKLEATLLSNVDASDPTILEHQGMFWLFASNLERGTQNHRLNLWSAPALLGPWTPHPANPIVNSPRGARPAGRTFLRGEDLIRPAQDCTRGYGTGVQFRRIVKLDTQHFEELPAGKLEPEQFPGWAGIHTYNQSADFEVVDGCVHRLDLRGKLEGLAGKTIRRAKALAAH